MKIHFLALLFSLLFTTLNTKNVFYNLILTALSNHLSFIAPEISATVNNELYEKLLYQRIKTSEINSKEIISCKKQIEEIFSKCEKEECLNIRLQFRENLKKCEEILKDKGFLNSIKENYDVAKLLITNFSKFAKITLNEIISFVTFISKEFKLSLFGFFRVTKYAIKLIRLYQNESLDNLEKVKLYGKYMSRFFKTIMKIGYSLQSVIAYTADKFLTVFLGINDLALSLNISKFLYSFSKTN